MAALEEERPSVEFCVTYLNLEGAVLRRFSETLSREELAAQAESWLDRWLDFALREREHRRQRDASIRTLDFPFPAYRAGQRELAAQVYTAISRKKRLFACLPTGTGKSAAGAVPCSQGHGGGENGQAAVSDGPEYRPAESPAGLGADEGAGAFRPGSAC